MDNILKQEFIIPSSIVHAKQIQKELRAKLSLEPDFLDIRTIAGVDVGYNRKTKESRASIVVIDYKTLKVLEQKYSYSPTSFPYIPGLLSFREIPAIIKTLKMLSVVPDMLMVDGQGIAHPMRMGIASHLGIIINIPSIGVAKSRLIGTYKEPGAEKGQYSKLMKDNEQLGYVLRSRTNVKPLFISPGHKIDHETSLSIVNHCLTRYRLPEPTRLADKLSKHR